MRIFFFKKKGKEFDVLILTLRSIAEREIFKVFRTAEGLHIRSELRYENNVHSSTEYLPGENKKHTNTP